MSECTVDFYVSNIPNRHAPHLAQAINDTVDHYGVSVDYTLCVGWLRSSITGVLKGSQRDVNRFLGWLDDLL